MELMRYSVEENYALARKIAEKVQEMGGRAYFVGGYVRDKIMARIMESESTDTQDVTKLKNPMDINTDFDMEIHGIKQDQLKELIASFGELVDTGENYGVYGLKEYDVDLALPRTERAIGRGHKDFEVTVDPFLGTEEAVMRRDFTMNALMEDVLTGEIVDHHGGVDDIRKKLIRHVSSTSFPEDPLRLFRAAQFGARFGYELAEETRTLCKEMDVTTLAKERVFGELKKALLKADKPSIFFEELRKMNRLSYWFPEVEALIGVKQNETYHMEGDVWAHTMMVLDYAAKERVRAKQPLGFMLSALCHDFGKSIATEYKDGAWHAYQHEKLGLPLVETFLARLTSESQLTKYVLNMVELHMRPHAVTFSESSIKKTNHMYDQALEPVDLVLLAGCDNRSSINELPFVDGEPFLMERLAIYEEYMSRPYVMGRDLVEAGMKPGKNFSDILEYAHKLRLAGVERESALKQTLAYAKKYE